MGLVERLIDNFDNEFDKYVQKGPTDFKAISLLVNTNPKMISTARGLILKKKLGQISNVLIELENFKFNLHVMD